MNAAGDQITKPLRDEPWQMREFGLCTIDGHCIMIGQETHWRASFRHDGARKQFNP